MPEWGLTKELRETRPWELPPEILAPGKVVTDPVHGDIYLNWLEVAIVDSGAFQRLRRVRQLGMTHLVYPGATHTRLSHSLGTVRVAQMLLDRILNQRDGLHSVPDLLGEWHDAGRVPYNSRVAEAVSLARLGALLHDLCHVPVGHSIEDDLEILEAHDENLGRFAELWGNLRESVRQRILRSAWKRTSGQDLADAVDRTLFDEDGRLYKQLLPLVISKQRVGGEIKSALSPDQMLYPFVADLVGNTICADLLDYLVRDHLFTGLPAELGERFTSAFFVVPSDRGPLSRRMALNIERQEHERTDVVSELLKALRYRYELSERALYHHAKLSADAMLGEALERWEGALWLEQAHSDLRALEGHEAALTAGETYKLKDMLARADKERAEQVRDDVRARLEREFITRGDDGLLEHMAALRLDGAHNGPTAAPARRLLGHSADLAQALLDRNLFRIAGRVGFKDTSASTLYARYGDPAARDRLEREAERYAELGASDPEESRIAPRVVIWLPNTKMKLKLAQVLVQHNGGVAPFVEYEESRSQRGSEIYAAHQRLWNCFVFVRRDVSKAEQDMIIAYLGGEMGVRWERYQRLGPHPEEWAVRLAIRTSDPDRHAWDDVHTDELVKSIRAGAARGDQTFSSLAERVRQTLRHSDADDGTGPNDAV